MEGCTCLVMDVYNLRNDEHLLQSVERESKLLSTIGIADSTPDGKDECCNEDTLNLWRHSLSEDIPTRLVLAKCPNLASLITATNIGPKTISCIHPVTSMHGSIVEFYDLHDAVEFCTQGKLVMESSTISDYLMFCCPSVLYHLYKNSAPSPGCLIVTVSMEHQSHPPDLNLVEEFFKKQGLCQFSNNHFQSIKSRKINKFFVEYFDTHKFSEILDGLDGEKSSCFEDSGMQVKWEICELFLNDRQILFYSDHHPASNGLDSHNIWDNTSANFIPTSSLSSSTINTHSGINGNNYHSQVPPHEYEIDFCRITNKSDSRTTCMIRNIPNKYTQSMLIDMINETHYGTFDFIYLRMDFKNKCNVGYAFINFIVPSSIVSFAERVMGKRWPRFNSDKICHLSYARIQGKAALVEKFRHSKVMMEPASYRPKVYHTEEGLRGREEVFPV